LNPQIRWKNHETAFVSPMPPMSAKDRSDQVDTREDLDPSE